MFHIDNRSRVPIHQQLQAQIVRYVSLGLLLPDQQLPSVRAMAQQLGINPNTVQKAYAALEMNGVLYTVAGRGAFISPEEDQLSQFKKLAADRFAAAVQAAADAGLTRQELAAALYRYYTVIAEKEVTTLHGVGGYPDRDALADNAASAFGWALQQGMFSAEDGYLRPGALVSRGQLAVALAKLLEITA